MPKPCKICVGTEAILDYFYDEGQTGSAACYQARYSDLSEHKVEIKNDFCINQRQAPICGSLITTHYNP
jgi:hypothetical protein